LTGLIGIAVMRSVLRHAHRPWLSVDGRPLLRSHWGVCSPPACWEAS
jgi:hypothetical protein